MSDTIIEVNNLKKVYSLPGFEVTALKGISFDVQQGDFISVMGHSGAGKTTLLNILGCLDSMTDGDVLFLGQSIKSLKEKKIEKIRKNNIGFVFQDFYLIPSLTAKENVELPLQFCDYKYDKEIAISLLKKVGLEHRVNHFPRELSGGEMQRTAIARALAVNPKIILADEPTGNLDTKNASLIFDMFKNFSNDGVTVIVASHNTTLANRANKIIKLEDGMIVL